MRIDRVVLAIVVLVFAGCETYEKDVSSNTFFSGLDGAEGPGVSRTGLGRTHDPRYLAVDDQRYEDEDGNIVLQSRGPRHLMRHIYETLRDDERELFQEYVLSEATKREFRENDTDPAEAFDMLKDEFESIDRLFARIPMAEHSPNVTFRRTGPGTYRLKLIRGAGRELRWQGFDMIQEDGNERLLWFYGER